MYTLEDVYVFIQSFGEDRDSDEVSEREIICEVFEFTSME